MKQFYTISFLFLFTFLAAAIINILSNPPTVQAVINENNKSVSSGISLNKLKTNNFKKNKENDLVKVIKPIKRRKLLW